MRHSGSTDIGLIVGSAAAVITIVIVVAVLSKKHGKATAGYSVEPKNEAVVITANQAGGLTHQNKAGVEE